MATPGRYDLYEELGKGAFGVTYRGLDRVTGQIVAIKVIDIENSTNKGLDENSIIKEIQTLQNISDPECHPYIACYQDAIKENFNGRPSIIVISEYIDGGNLQDYINKLARYREPADYVTLWRIMKQLISALDFVHAKGYAHRDIKPENIMLTSDGDVKLIDFGLACTAQYCKSGAGTLYWFAPEIFTDAPNSLNASQKHDIWASGIVFYQLANLHFPFPTQYMNGQSLKPADLAIVINQPLVPSSYSSAPSDSHVTNQTFNNIIMSMLNQSCHERPTARQLMQYISEEDQGIMANGQRINRTSALRVLQQGGYSVDPNAPMSVLSSHVHAHLRTPVESFPNYSHHPTASSRSRKVSNAPVNIYGYR